MKIAIFLLSLHLQFNIVPARMEFGRPTFYVSLSVKIWKYQFYITYIPSWFFHPWLFVTLIFCPSWIEWHECQECINYVQVTNIAQNDYEQIYGLSCQRQVCNSAFNKYVWEFVVTTNELELCQILFEGHYAGSKWQTWIFRLVWIFSLMGIFSLVD